MLPQNELSHLWLLPFLDASTLVFTLWNSALTYNWWTHFNSHCVTTNESCCVLTFLGVFFHHDYTDLYKKKGTWQNKSLHNSHTINRWWFFFSPMLRFFNCFQEGAITFQKFWTFPLDFKITFFRDGMVSNFHVEVYRLSGFQLTLNIAMSHLQQTKN